MAPASTFEEVQPGLFAFWGYDQFPFLLGGEITHMNARGMVYTREFGFGSAFQPLRVMPVEAGKALKAQLDTLKASFNAEVAKVQTKYDTELDRMLKEAGVQRR